MKRKKTTTLKKKVLFSMVLLVIFQISAILGILLLTKTNEKLDSNNVEILCNFVNYRGETLETMMAEWSDLSDWITATDSITSSFEETAGLPASSLISDDTARKQLLDELSATVLEHLRFRGTTGAFIILSDGTDSDAKDAIYLRDLNPKDTSMVNHDILVEAGLGSDGFEKGFTLDINWALKLKLGDDRDFYDKPMQAAIDFPEMTEADLGYWSGVTRMIANDIQVITYSVPLLDSNHYPIGVMGIELSLDYLQNELNGSEISIADSASYLLGKSSSPNTSEHVYETVSVDSVYHQRLLGDRTDISFVPSKKNPNISELAYDSSISDQSCHFTELRLYNTNTPFSGESWILAGIVNTSQLYESSRHFMLAMAFALTISLAMGILCSVFTTSIMFRPLHQMMQGLKCVSFTTSSLPRIGIVEIDELAVEIERLKHNAFMAGSKAADIIDMSNVSLGIYEYTQELSDEVFCTRKFFELTELPLDGWNENYMNRSRFFRLLEEFQQKCTYDPENNSICFFTTESGSKRYLEIKNVHKEGDELYVYLDVTAQVLEKEKITHERDYDVLTDLFNRRAFARTVSRLMNEHLISSGVLSMWDLDNLKYVNDTYGHDMGDQYICTLAEEFRKLSYPNSVMARISGDEFMLFLYDGEPSQMCKLLEKVHASFLGRKLLMPDGNELPLSVSAGMALYGEDSDSYDSLVKLSDFAMYEVKHYEKGAIRRFHRDTYEKNYILNQGTGELKKILDAEYVHFAFQPIVDLKRKEVFAYEALMRPDSRILYNPNLLLRAADKQAKLRQIEKLTWFHAIQSFSRQKDVSCTEKLFFNSLPNQGLTNEEYQELERLYGDYLSHIVIEVSSYPKSGDGMNGEKNTFCRSHKIGIALDNLKNGYTCASLKNSGYDYVKIDSSMIRDIHLSEEKQAFAKDVMDCCRQYHIRVIFVGVETQEEYQAAAALGADYIQGYYLCRPVVDLADVKINYE